jgi:Raf kinase inhibitor-like YbhB/YbcL family protein
MPQVETLNAKQQQPIAWELSSASFREGTTIPERHTAAGEDLSPALSWGKPPPKTRSLAIICEDPDAAAGPFIHWLIWNIDESQRELPEAVPPAADAHGLRQGENGFGKIGYAGPKPPPQETHSYVFRIYALDSELALQGGATQREFHEAIAGHVLAETKLTGKYGW